MSIGDWLTTVYGKDGMNIGDWLTTVYGKNGMSIDRRVEHSVYGKD